MGALLLLLVLQWSWPGRFSGAHDGQVAFASLMSLPLTALVIGLWRGRPAARFWSGVMALFYFCHGIAEAWAVPGNQLAGLVEAALSVLVVLASSWAGLRARLGPGARRNV